MWTGGFGEGLNLTGARSLASPSGQSDRLVLTGAAPGGAKDRLVSDGEAEGPKISLAHASRAPWALPLVSGLC